MAMDTTTRWYVKNTIKRCFYPAFTSLHKLHLQVEWGRGPYSYKPQVAVTQKDQKVPPFGKNVPQMTHKG